MAINQLSPKKSKKELAKELGVSRQSLYYQPKLPVKDLKLKTEIEKVLVGNKTYGHAGSFSSKYQQEKSIAGYEAVWT